MEGFMSGLLARATGKSTIDSIFHQAIDHVGGLIADEPILREHSISPYEDTSSDSSSLSESEVTDSSDMNSSTYMQYPSYVSLCGSPNYSSSPTYIRGDFYSLTPPASQSLGQSPICTSNTSPRQLSFSIDAILGNNSSNIPESDVSNDSAAQIISSATAAEYTAEYQQKDSLLCPIEVNDQISKRNDDRLSAFLYWCHVCEDFCENHEDACTHQEIHFTNTEHSHMRRNIFEQNGYVTAHEMTGYMNKLKCGLCERIVSYRFFKVHLRCHEGHVCDICDQEFPSPCRLRDHRNSHYGYKPHICRVCCEQFSDRRDLNVHSRKHKPCIFQCNFCSKSFRTRHAQTVHLRTHTDRSSFACCIPGCRKSFSQSVLLQLHLKGHRNHDDF